jgi:hypothetical protein
MEQPTASRAAPPNNEDIARSLTVLKGRDRLGIAGNVAGVVGGAAGGAAAAGAIAGALGGTTLLGSSTLGSLLGGVLVTTTPVGWVVGCAALGGAAAYVVVKVVRSGGRQDERRHRLASVIRKRRNTINASYASPIGNTFETEVEEAMNCGALSDSDAARMRLLVSQGHLPADVALKRLRLVAKASSSRDVSGR